MYEECIKRQNRVREMFASCSTLEDRYKKIIELGKANPAVEKQYKTEPNRVHGCQSTMYLQSWLENGKVHFKAESDALISSGLAAVLILVYSGLSAEDILKCPPDYLEELKLAEALTPNRANGLYSIHLKMKQDALRLLMGK